MSKIIPDEHFREVCRPGEGALTCRYVTASGEGICCEKHSHLARYLDKRVADNLFTAKGDNCEGLR